MRAVRGTHNSILEARNAKDLAALVREALTGAQSAGLSLRVAASQ
jgi:hypothetical protein